MEAFNSALRRRMACFRRKTNTYAMNQPALQTRLDAYWVLHNFIRPHFTTKQVPAVSVFSNNPFPGSNSFVFSISDTMAPNLTLSRALDPVSQILAAIFIIRMSVPSPPSEAVRSDTWAPKAPNHLAEMSCARAV